MGSIICPPKPPAALLKGFNPLLPPALKVGRLDNALDIYKDLSPPFPVGGKPLILFILVLNLTPVWEDD